VSEEVDVLIDFSNHVCIDDILSFGISKGIPLVICTTGFTGEEKQRMSKAAENIPILNSANMSIGVNLILSLVRQAAAALYGDFDIEIVEKHHNQKADSPSGTALMIADAINESLNNELEYNFGRHSKTEKRGKRELGIHAVRGGAIVGEHDVIFAGGGEVIEINHSALSRDVFAHGALRAARFLADKENGLYSMKDVISETI
jgi:4-hydroxy-tetrahydrodipicolinate reductase